MDGGYFSLGVEGRGSHLLEEMKGGTRLEERSGFFFFRISGGERRCVSSLGEEVHNDDFREGGSCSGVEVCGEAYSF